LIILFFYDIIHRKPFSLSEDTDKMLFLNNSPATGNTNMIIWIIVGLAAAALLAFYFIRRRKK